MGSAPVTPMDDETWQRILSHLSPPLLSSPLSAPLVPALRKEVQSTYVSTVRKTTIQMTLVKPDVLGLLPDPPLHAEKM